jgi:hypothetical protein
MCLFEFIRAERDVEFMKPVEGDTTPEEPTPVSGTVLAGSTWRCSWPKLTFVTDDDWFHLSWCIGI